MLNVWKVALVTLVGVCCVSAVQQCSCLVRETCIASKGTVSHTSENNSSNTCGGGDVMCCAVDASASPLKDSQSTLQLPKVAPGGGCGRKRLPAKGEKPSSNTTFYGDAPWTVEILTENLSLRCSGSLISPKVVLTVEHCIGRRNESRSLKVRAGEYVAAVRNKPLAPQIRNVYKIISHPRFSEHSIENDIALMVLDYPMELSPVVDVICTPEEGQEVDTTGCFTTGFGITTESGKKNYDAVFKKMKYAYLPTENCIEKLISSNNSKYFHESNICGMDEEGNNVNLGGGGGPFFCPSRADPNKMVQIGIASWVPNSNKGVPTVFTSVKHYLPWLKETLNEIS